MHSVLFGLVWLVVLKAPISDKCKDFSGSGRGGDKQRAEKSLLHGQVPLPVELLW